MPDESQHAEAKDPRVDAALREYLERVDRGESVNREEFLSRHAEIANALRSFIAAEEEVRKLAGGPARHEVLARRDVSGISTRSFAAGGQETIQPKSKPDRVLGTTGSGLAGQFGRYQIIRALGSGAMGAVYLAKDTQLKRNVAIKTPHFEDDPTGELVARFHREAEAAATLRHANICPVYDVGEIDGKHYISMAYIEGHPLSELISAKKPQTERQILIAVHKLANALHQAHAHGIVHRDLKPANIMIDKLGEPLIMDFGLARKTRAEGEASLTHSGMLLGSPAYMSPEQVEGDQEQIGPATDQYSLGVILYELLTGQLPFRGTVVNVLAQIITKEPTRPSELRAGLDPRIEAVCQKMMAKNAADRFASMKAVAGELATIVRNPDAKSAPTDKASATSNGPPRAPDQRGSEAPVSQILKSAKQKALTASDLTSLEELAGKCLARRDFDQVVKIVERVPEERRSAGLQSALEKAREKTDEIAFLICAIDEADRLEDAQAALKKAEELLKIKPGHHRAREIEEKYSGYGDGGAARIGPLRQFTQPWNEGGWIPWSVLTFGLAVFAVMTGVIVVYLNKTAVLIDIQDPGVEVAVKGTTLTVTGPDKQSVKVVPGDQELKITSAGLETTTRSFSLKKGEKKTVTVSIVNKEIVARLENEILPPPPARDEKTSSNPIASGASPSVPLTSAHEEQTTTTLPPTFKNTLGMEFVLVPKGKSWLGGGGGRPGDKEVVMAHDFYLGKYEVTQEEWEKVMGGNPSHFSHTGRGKDMVKDFADAELKRFPVEQVSWDDAQLFLVRLNKGEREAGWIYCLPKEAEWEYACRGGPLSDKLESGYNFYVDKPTNRLFRDQANFGRGEPDTELRRRALARTCKVGSYKPNRLGLYDMHGNVLEWCDDTEKVADGASHREDRGGCWRFGSDGCRAGDRSAAPPSSRSFCIGLRVARVPVGERRASPIAGGATAPQLLVAPFGEATAHKGQETWASHLNTGVHLSNAIGMKLVLIAPGEFQMGSTNPRLPNDVRPVHRVRITKPFYMGIYEVTQEEYQRIMGGNPSHFRDDPRLPVESMSSQNIQDFCRKLSAMPEEMQAGTTYRLPTEAEWEYACRAGTTTRFHFGDVMSSELANLDGDNPGVNLPHGPNLERTTRVGSYRPNSFGLYDMHGNVIEVVSDSYSADYYSTSPVDDPQGPNSGDLGIARGGGWKNPAVPSAYRYSGPKSTIDAGLGFRVVCDFGARRADNATASGDPDRGAAEWVLSIGGTIKINENGSEREIKSGGDLSRGTFELTVADLDRNPKLTDAGLACFKDCKNLTALNLNNTQVSDAGLAYFKDCKHLTTLALGGATNVTNAGLACFKDCKNLTSLWLDGCAKVSDSGLAHFKDCKHFTFLGLHGTQATDAGLAYFKDCKNLTSLEAGTQVSDSGLAYFKDCRKLSVLSLNGNVKVTNDGLACFKDKNITDLNVGWTQVTDAGLFLFKDCKDLTTVTLIDTQVSDSGLACFKDCKILATLYLDETEVSDAGLKRLAGLRRLRFLFVKKTKVTEAGVKKLAASLPQCKIEWDGGVIGPSTGVATTNPPTADGIPAIDLFQPKSTWVGNKKPRLVLTVTERKGANFRAKFAVGPGITRMISGTVKDGKVDWFAKDVIAVKGRVGDDNHGTIASDDLGDKIDFVWGPGSEIKGKFTLRLQK